MMNNQQVKEGNLLEVDGVVRSRCNSLGNSIHETETEIIAFWRWFGGSRAVDDRGRPLVLFHGTYAVFDVFRIGHGSRMSGIFFTDDRECANDWAKRKGGSGEPIIIEAYMKVDAPAEESDVLDAERALSKRTEGFDSATLTRRLKREGFDGYLDESRYEDALEIVAFNPKQIRLVGARFSTRKS